MMECNREEAATLREAVRARRIAVKKLEKRDFSGAQRVALQAQRLFPELENLSQLLTICKVCCAAEAKINRQLDWYDILQVQVTADGTLIRKQYDELKFWLDPTKNTLPGAEAAFKLVSEAHMILSDHVKRSRYDIKRQTAGVSDKTLGKRNGAGHVQPYDCAIVFWTICPHCQKRFVYYQRNFLAVCDYCGKNFFAFKLSEQAVPSRYLSIAPDNSQVSLQMVSCQQPGVIELRSTGGSVDFEPTVDSTCTEEHITWVGISDAQGKGSSERRSNVVHCSVANQSHASPPSADKGATGSMTLESTASDVVISQKFGREDASTVPDATGSCNLQMLGKRKHDDCADRGHMRDSCINKKQNKDDSHSDANYTADKMYNDDVAVANTQAAKHVSDTMDNQGVGNATHEGSQQKYEEATYIASQTHGNPGIAYDCTGSINSWNSCNDGRQRKDNSLANTNPTDEKVCSDNVAGCENQIEEPVHSTLDSQDDGNKTQEGSQQNYKKDGMDIDAQTHCAPVITYERSDFFDFRTLRKFNMIAVDQIWAIYDDHDSMPRNYAQINHVNASNNNVQLTWLEHNTTNLQETRWTRKELPVACGNFCLGETCVLEDPSMYLSHKVSWVAGKNRNSFEIHPKKAEIWALYKESSLLWSQDTDNHQSVDFDVVEVSDDSTSDCIIVFPLVKIEGFVSLFAEPKDKTHILIPASQLHRFSHSIPYYKTNGTEKVGVGGLLELDTGALPCDLATVFPSITLDSFIGFNKEKVTEFVSITYPGSEFYNFVEDRSCEKFELGQIWALYSTDTFPNLYGWINKAEKEPFKVRLTWLEAFPQGVDKHWLEQDIPVSCGTFVIQNSTTEHCETSAFSHLVVNRWEIGTNRQVNILPKVGEVWAIYENWTPDWVPSSKDCPAKYAIGEIKMCAEGTILFAFLTKVDGHRSVFKPDVQKGALLIQRKENLRFSHRIPSFRLTKENGGKLCGFYELDPAAIPNLLMPDLSQDCKGKCVNF